MESGDTVDGVGEVAGIGEKVLGAGCQDEGGRNGVDADVILAPLDGETFGEMGDGGFGHAVNGFGGESHKAGLGTHIDDDAALLANHDAAGGLAGKESAFEIDSESGIEISFADVFGGIFGSDAGVVDKNVEPSEFFHGVIDGAEDLIFLGDIHLEGKGAAAEGTDFGGEAGVGMDIAETEGDVGTGIGESERDGAAESAGGAGDEGNLAGHVEVGKVIHVGAPLRESYRV